MPCLTLLILQKAFSSTVVKRCARFLSVAPIICMVTEKTCIPETFPRCVISILYVHISLLPVTVMLIVFSSFLSLMLSLKEPYRETSMGVKLNIAYQM